MPTKRPLTSRSPSLNDLYALAAAHLEYGWGKNACAKDASGVSVVSSDPSAECWCIAGAIFAAAKLLDAPNLEEAALDRLTAVLTRNYQGKRAPSLQHFNDRVAQGAGSLLKLISEAADGH